MKLLQISLSVFFISVFSIVQAQKVAVTDTGEEVILNADGTWEYKKGQSQLERKEEQIKVNETPFLKPKSATFQIKSKRTDNGFWINPKEWSFGPGKENPDAEYQLKLKGEDLYAMVIAEGIEVDLVNLRNLAVQNAKNAAPDIQVVQQEYRTVNNRKVLFVEMRGTLNGIKIAYYSYYYSDASGSVQYITYTAQNLLKKYKKQCDNLLNGMVGI